MAYNAIFNVSSSISLIQPERAAGATSTTDRDGQGSLTEPPPVRSTEDTAVRFSTLQFIPTLASAFPPTSPTRRKDKGQRSLPMEGAKEDYTTEEAMDPHDPYQDTSDTIPVVRESDSKVTVIEAQLERSSPPSDPAPRFDFCRRELIPVKLFYFSFIGALGVILPYCAVFLKQLGLGAFQIGIISGARPALGFISAPIWGSLADKFNLRRSMMMVSMLAWLGFFVGLYMLSPPGRLRTPYPDQPSLHRSSVRFRRSEDVASKITDGNTTSGSEWDFLTNTSSCNYSSLGDADRELLKENLLWIYEPSEVYLKFIVCLLIICGGELFQAPTTALTDAATLQLLGRENLGHYGAQRAWGPIGWAISSLVVGSLLNANRWRETICGIDLVFSDYRVIAYIFIVVMVFGLIAGYNIDFSNSKDDQPSGNKAPDLSNKAHNTMAVVKLFLNVHYGSWILTAFYVGLLNGVIWGFLFWHLDNLGGSQLLMGIDGVVMCVFEFTAFFLVDHVIKLIGHMGIMYIGLIGYSIRFLIYASLSNPWLVLPADALQGVTFSFIWVSLTAYTAVAVPSVSLGTVQGIVHGVYFGLGNGLGHLIGGILIGTYGAVTTFYAFSATTVAWLFFFVVCQKLSKKPSIEQFSYQDISSPDKLASTENRYCDPNQTTY